MSSQSDATSVSVAGWWRSPTATRNSLVVLLAIAAGFSDALGYVGLGRVFTANMTGNTIFTWAGDWPGRGGGGTEIGRRAGWIHPRHPARRRDRLADS